MTVFTENPFTPTFGQIPPVMAGRSVLLDDYIAAFQRQARSPELTTLVSGARGTGKTALLARLGEEAEAHGWLRASVSCTPGMLEDIYTRSVRAASRVFGEDGGSARLTGLGVGQVLNLSWERREGPSNWRSRMEDVLDILDTHETGLLISVDEIRDGMPEMIQLASVYQHFVSEDRRVSLIMAGLPFTIGSLIQDKSVSFYRRAHRENLGRVDAAEVAEAFTRTIELGGRTIDSAALELAVQAIDGFPFMMQLVGYRTWNRHPERLSIDVQDVHQGIELARREMRDQVLDATYRELSDGDVAFLNAMLPDDGTSSLRDIAVRLGKTSAHVDTYKKRMLRLGVVGERRRGYIGFDIPGFAEFLREKRDEG